MKFQQRAITYAQNKLVKELWFIFSELSLNVLYKCFILYFQFEMSYAQNKENQLKDDENLDERVMVKH